MLGKVKRFWKDPPQGIKADPVFLIQRPSHAVLIGSKTPAGKDSLLFELWKRYPPAVSDDHFRPHEASGDWKTAVNSTPVIPKGQGTDSP